MSKPTRIKTPSVAAPRTREQAEQLLADIGHLQRRVTDVETSMNDKLSKIKAQFEQEAQPLNTELDEKFRALHAWSEAHRDELLDGKAKTCKLATGEILWRSRPPSVRITGEKDVIERLKRMGHGDLIRTEEKISKEAILQEPDRVEGVKGLTVVTGVEDFVAKPFSTEIERSEPVLRKAA